MQGETRGGGITLRRKAEQTLESSMLPPEKLSTEDAQRLIHELRVHQIELEMQNEELRRVQNELEISRSRYADLYDFAPVGYLTLKKNGQIVEPKKCAKLELSKLNENTRMIRVFREGLSLKRGFRCHESRENDSKLVHQLR